MLFKILSSVKRKGDYVMIMCVTCRPRDLHLLTYFGDICCGSRNLRVATFQCIFWEKRQREKINPICPVAGGKAVPALSGDATPKCILG